jgi:uncharacterized membrane protein
MAGIAFMGGSGLLSFNTTLGLLAACCVGLLVGFSWRERRWAPWLMLAAAVCLLALMAYSIIGLLSSPAGF